MGLYFDKSVVFILGVDTIEMRAVERLLNLAGVRIMYATKNKQRVTSFHDASHCYVPVDLPDLMPVTVVMVECYCPSIESADWVTNFQCINNPSEPLEFSDLWDSSLVKVRDWLMLNTVDMDGLLKAIYEFDLDKESVSARLEANMSKTIKAEPDLSRWLIGRYFFDKYSIENAREFINQAKAQIMEASSGNLFGIPVKTMSASESSMFFDDELHFDCLRVASALLGQSVAIDYDGFNHLIVVDGNKEYSLMIEKYIEDHKGLPHRSIFNLEYPLAA